MSKNKTPSLWQRTYTKPGPTSPVNGVWDREMDVLGGL